MVGDSLSRDGDRRGNFIVAAKRSAAETVPCRKPPAVSAADTSGAIGAGTELATTCVVEEIGAPWNALFAYGYYPLGNHATLPVCSSNDPDTNPHPDNAYEFEAMGDGVFCYTGYSAGLNDINGTERGLDGLYRTGEEHCHYIVMPGGFEVPAAKRPATRSYPFPGSVNPKTPIVWRPVNPNLRIAN
jgi:hypothetical protein